MVLAQLNHKRNYDIDILILVRRNMDLYEDGMALVRWSEVHWVECKEPDTKVKELGCPRSFVIVK
jgi:hypothetical protein